MANIVDLIQFMPTPEEQLAMHGGYANIQIPKNWVKKTDTEVLLLRRTGCCLGTHNQMACYDFSDSVRRLTSSTLSDGKETTFFSWDSRADDLFNMKEALVAGSFFCSLPKNRFVVMDLAGTERSLSRTVRKAGSEVIQLITILLNSLVTKTMSRSFDFPVSGLITAYDENGDDMCLCMNFFKGPKASYLTFRHVSACDIGPLRGLNLITVRELRKQEY